MVNNAISEEINMSFKKILVVYFSRTGEQYNIGNISEGNTAIIAKMIAEQADADIFEIKPEHDIYPTTYKALTEVALAEKNAKARPEIKGDITDFADYDLVFIGCPNWWSDMPMVVYTFMEKYNWHDKMVVPFVTHEGSGLASIPSKMKKATGAMMLEGFEIQGHIAQNERDKAREDVAVWLKKIMFYRKKTMTQTYLTLNNGIKMPQFGLGVFLVPEGKETIDVCLNALSLGYRHIDTAHAYQNERGVGEALRLSGLNREDVWITSKLWPTEYGEGVTSQAIDRMLERLQTDYIDLLLLHQQVGDYIGAWKDLEKALKNGKARAIGISNFSDNLEDFLAHAAVKPAAIQVECHPYYPQHKLKKRMEEYGTILESWYPLGHGDEKLLNEPVFNKLAQKYNKTPVQIILRWHIQEGNSVFPKTTNPAHLQENLGIFDFKLTDNDMKEIAKLDKGIRYYNATLEEQQRFLNWKPED